MHGHSSAYDAGAFLPRPVGLGFCASGIWRNLGGNLRIGIADLEGALKAIAAEASVPVYTWKNGINFKKMYEGWRKIATSRIDIARATIGEIKGESHE